jgi:drug/metabolite transporter (DMT)-like permease
MEAKAGATASPARVVVGPTPLASRRLLIALALIATYVIWGSTYYAMAVAIKSVPPFLMASMRYVTAGVLLVLILRLSGAAFPTRRQWQNAAVVGGLLLFVGNGAVAFALQYVNSSTTALTVATTPAWAAIVAIFFTAVRPRWIEWLGIALGLAGVVLLHYKSQLPLHPVGLAALLIATMSWALGSIWSKHLDLPQGLMASGAQMLSGGLMLFALSRAKGEHLVQVPSLQSLLALAYLVLFGAMIAFSAYGYLLKTVSPTLATSNALVNPLVAVAIGVGLGGEPFTLLTVVAMLVILAGVALLAIAHESPQEPS